MVVGYGVQKKVNLTGAVTAVDTKDLEDRTTHNLTDMLQGAVPEPDGHAPGRGTGPEHLHVFR